ncbi:MAG TPA: hypothetical protein PLZ36_00140 [Armatimonadota bacterium]|nr:hypothetical protein [Armatimonadota bacterium]
MRRWLFGLLACAVLGLPALPAGAAESFVLRDWLNRTWRNERVTFPLTAAQLTAARAGQALAGPDGAPVPYQVITDGATQQSSLVFLAHLDPFETRTYAFAENVANVESDLRVEERPEGIVLSNRLTGIAINAKLDGGAGPIAGVKLNSGVWAGGSTLTSDPPVASYEARVTARGPVYAEVVARAEFADGSTWTLRAQVIANEPVVLIDEIAAVKGTATFTVNLDRGFAPTKILYRYGKQVPNGSLGKNETVDIGHGRIFTLEPWLRWSEQINQGNTFSLYKPESADLLAVGAREAGAWVDPQLKRDDQMPNRALVTKDDAGIFMAMGLKTGQRKWMYMALDRAASLKDLDTRDGYHSPLPNQTLIKYGHFPLDLVKDYVLSWAGDHENYPRVLVTRKDVARFTASVKDPTPYEKAIPRYLADPNPLGQFNMEERITAYFATGDEKLAEYLAKGVTQLLQGCVDRLVVQHREALGTAPHHFQEIGCAALLADAVLSHPTLDPRTRERLLAQLAFLGYTVSRPEYWSPARGYAANPNMTTSVYGYKAVIACAIPSHPLAKEWARDAMEELKGQINGWSDANGGWLEAPHYAMVSYDQILGAFVMAHNAGFNTYLDEPKMKTVINWFSKISTPPDSRIGGFRHLPPAGNTYLQEPTGEFGIVAFLFRDRDPEFAAQMQWMHRQHKSFPYPGIGGGYPAFAGYRALMIDPAIPERAPAWGSELFPETGVILRTGFPDPRETQLYLIGGTNHAHYDDDSGSITIYGKGRILADDFGYYNPAREDHSMLTSPVSGGGVMTLKGLTTRPQMDYTLGERGGWTRQIALVKDADPLGPNYFVLADSLRVPTSATWRLWCYAETVRTRGNAALVVGKEDVDMDVIFAAPAGLALATRAATRRANCALHPDGRMGVMDMTQIGLEAPVARENGYLVVLYPRLKAEAAPTVTPLAGGKGVRVETPAGTDLIFLSSSPFTYDEGGVQFTGTAGMVRVRDGQYTLTLGAPGHIAAGGKELKEGTVAPASNNLIPGGDFEDGAQRFFVADMPNYGTAARLHAGSPVPGDDANTFCAALTMTGTNGIMGSREPIYVDPTKTYRLHCKFFTAAKFSGSIAGYGWNAGGQQCKNDAGGVWQWNLTSGPRQGPTGPTAGWQTLSCVIGPAGSGAPYSWPADVVSINFGFWMAGDAGATVYLDDIMMEEVPAE